MATTTPKRSLHVSLNEDAQLEIPDPTDPSSPDYDHKLADAQRQLEFLHAKRAELERQKIELEELNQLKQEFLNGQLELSEKLSATMTAIEREVYDLRQDIQDMEQTKNSFAKHLARIENINPEAWPKDSLKSELDRALSLIDQADDEYAQAADYFSGQRHRGLFGSVRSSATGNGRGDFQAQLRHGLAFNLPLLILGALALILYLFK
ncbi:MAG: hypothetical protein ACQKBY_10875 [Verrucomicrobiales bacterium]